MCIFILMIVALNHTYLYVRSCNTAKTALRDVDVRKCNNMTQKRLITLLFAVMTSNRWKGAYKVSYDITHDLLHASDEHMLVSQRVANYIRLIVDRLAPQITNISSSI